MMLFKKTFTALSCFSLSCFSLTWLHAQTTSSSWENAVGGSFGDIDSWSDGVPGEETWAMFGPDKADPEEGNHYTVELDRDRTLEGLYFNQGDKTDLTLDLGGHILTLTSSSTTNHALHVDGSTTFGRNLTVENGELVVGVGRVGQLSSHEQSSLIVRNKGILRVQSEMRVGNSGHGLFRLEGTGTLTTTARFVIGAAGSSTGHAIIDGPEVHFGGSSNLAIGSSGQGRMEVINGAVVDRSGHVHVGEQLTGVGLFEVNTGSSFLMGSGSRIRLGGRNDDGSAAGGQGHAIFSTGATVRTGLFVVFSGSTLEINDASLIATSTVDVGNNWFAGSTYRIHLNAEDATPALVHNLNLSATPEGQEAGPGGTLLDVRLGEGFVAELGNMYTLVEYSGSLTGLFVDEDQSVLNEGSELVIDGYTFTLSYGSGIDSLISVELTNIPEASHISMIIALVVLCAARFFRFKK